MKKNLSLLMGVLLALAWYVTLSTWLGNESKYQDIIAEAQRLEGKELYLDAIAQYEKAEEIKGSTLELEEYIAADYLAMGDYKKYQQQMRDILNSYGPVEADVKGLVGFHQKYSSQGTLIDCVNDLYAQYPDSEVVRTYYDSLKGIYTESYLSTEKIENFRGNYAVYEQNGRQGLLNQEGKEVIEAVYDEIIYDGKNNDAISVRDGADWFYITRDGYKVKEPEGDYEYLDVVSGQRILAKKNGKYGYLDSDMREKTEFIYDDATAIYDGVGAVKQGDKWALINKNGKTVTEFVYDDVAVNNFGICSLNKLIGVSQNGVWFFVNAEGERIGEQSFEDMKAFESEQPCAVCLNDKWGYLDIEGNLVIECSYEDAKSFMNDYAPVCEDGLWGYIDLNNYLSLDYSFVDAGNFTGSGVAPVSHGDTWTLIQLVVKN